MNLGQTLMVIMALVLFSTITVSINRLKVNATVQTVDILTDLEAINYGQSVMEGISKTAATSIGYANLQDRTLSPITTNSGRLLFASVVVDDSGLELHDVEYKRVTVSVYSDSS